MTRIIGQSVITILYYTSSCVIGALLVRTNVPDNARTSVYHFKNCIQSLERDIIETNFTIANLNSLRGPNNMCRLKSLFEVKIITRLSIKYSIKYISV